MASEREGPGMGFWMRDWQNSNEISQDITQGEQQQASAPSEHICFMIEIMINERAGGRRKFTCCTRQHRNVINDVASTSTEAHYDHQCEYMYILRTTMP